MMVENPLQGPLERLGSENRKIFGPKWHSLCFCFFRISGPKKVSIFQGPPLPMVLVIDTARIKIITSRAIKATGTLLIVNSYLLRWGIRKGRKRLAMSIEMSQKQKLEN
jgi:hypothetical protein